MDSAFQTVNRRSLNAWIQDNPTVALVERREKLQDGAGGYTYGPWMPIGMYTMRRVGSSLQSASVQDLRSSGELDIHISTFVGQVDECDVQKADRIRDASGLYEVNSVNNDEPPWACRAEVRRIA
jgi:hypothetical protein